MTTQVPEVIVRRLLLAGRYHDSGSCRYCGCDMFEDRTTEDTHNSDRCPILELSRAVGIPVGSDYVEGV